MKTDAKVLPVSVRSITFGALTIALIVVFITFFKGVTNILNAFFVPMILFSFSINRKAIELLAVFAASIATCALFFNLQLIFIVFYCIIAFILSTLNRKNIGVALSAIILSVTITFFFWSAIILTDMIFKTRMNEIMLKILNGNRLVYLLILAFEGTVVGISQLFASRLILKKLCVFERN